MEALNKIQFHDIINLADIQHFQDLFSDATGVASIITHPDGTPITNPSNFSRLCNSIIRKTEKGCANCYKSDSVIGRYNPSGPVIQSCLSGGLWDAGASIAVGGKHIANWLIGQVRNIEIDDQHMMKYADEIGADKTVFMEALNEVPVMSVSKFKKVSEMMFAFVNEISEKAYNNWQLKTQISERTQTELLLKEKNKQIEKQKEELVEINIELAFQNKEKGKRAAELTIANKELLFQNKEKEKRAAELVIANNELAFQNEEKGKRAAELIIAKEQAEESDNLKTSFLNNISHEIRTPFNGILGFLDIMQDNDLTVKERAEFTTIVNKSAFRLMNTIDNIIEISQIQAGQIEPCLQKTNLQRLTSEIYSHFKTEAEIKGLELLITKQLRVNVENIYTDSSKLKTILTILIGNAIKFTKTGSIELGVKMKMDDIAIADFGEGNPSGSTLQFSVKDSGVSIPEDKQESIFKKFIQADGSNTRDFEGSGLGLAIAKAYVKMLGGKIWVESKEGNGSEFFFTIPIIQNHKILLTQLLLN